MNLADFLQLTTKSSSFLLKNKKRKQQKYEKAQGTMAHQVDLFDRTQGGYASGRMETDDEVKARLKRHGRLSDIMGNSGVMEKVHRSVGK